MRWNLRSWAGLTAVLCAAMAGPIWAASAHAQTQGQPPPLSALPYILRLQPDQREAWRTYTDAIAQDNATRQSAIDMAQRLNLMQTPERLDAMVDQMKSDEAAFQRRAAATKAFFAVLSPEQKQTFDTVTRLPTEPRPTQRPPTPARSTLPQPQNPSALPPPSASPLG